MFLYLTHEIMNAISYTKDWLESKKNCITFMIGLYLHFFFFLLLEYLSKSKFMGGLCILFRQFYWYFIFIDGLTMAIKYKVYWGRNIMNELDGDDEWELDDNHRYHRKDDINYNLRREREKMVILKELTKKYCADDEIIDLYKRYLKYRGNEYIANIEYEI